ncbi:hypothetical protein BSKO_03708 [Bryopsis sp. KO-2023]|nr:hypothetical protein BSKO_03708 [Bryopsis sp. KO-2023]
MGGVVGAKGPYLVPYWHLALLAVGSLPLFVQVPAELNIVLTAVLTVFVGCWRSVKPQGPTETMSKKDAMRFPLIGSVVLVSLFLAFKLLPKNLVNTILSTYFVLLGTIALTGCLAPFFLKRFPKHLQHKEYGHQIKIPFVSEPLEMSATVPELAVAPVALVFCGWYFFQKHWYANNILGIAFSIQGIEHLSLGSVHVGTILLSGLFFYDIFWVFFTPVMVTVAKSFDAPIKLLFPRVQLEGDLKRPFSMLGLGDIVIPGIFVALLLRFDVVNDFKTKYFYSAFGGYIGGLAMTIVVMNVFNAAQPALLYIVPAVLGSVFLHALKNGEFKQVFNFKEKEREEEKEKGKAE